MKIICDRNQLNEAIRVVSRAVAVKSNLAAVEGILLVAEEGGLTLTGYDFETGIKTTFECQIMREGSVVLSSQLLGNMVRKITSDDIYIECDDSMNTIIKGGNAQYNIKGIDPDTYPDFPGGVKDNIVKLDKKLFSEMCDHVIYAVSNDQKRPVHTGVLIEMSESTLTMVATDGYRLAICDREVDFEGQFRMVVPAKAMNEVRKLTGEEEGKITIYPSRRFVMFQVDEYVIVSRLLEGEFIPYRKTLPKSFMTETVIKTRDLSEAIERVSLIITERLRNPVKLNLEEGTMKIRCKTEIGEVYDEIAIGQVGPDIEIGFNNKYLLDAMKRSKKDELIFKFGGSLAACEIIPKEGSDFIYLVLPVRFKDGNN